MDILNERRQGSVTERLSARLDEIEPVVGRLLKNEAKLIADALAMEARVRMAERGLSALAAVNGRLDFISRSFWQRLRWLVTGK